LLEPNFDLEFAMDETLLIVIVSIAGGLAIVCAIVAGAVAITRIATRHRERMARIGMGLDPDAPDSVAGLPREQSTPNEAAAGWDHAAATRSPGPRPY
jgi:hypothetical protein